MSPSPRLSIAWLSVALLALCCGCASTQLVIHTDIYDEDPRFFAPMTPDEATELATNLEKLRGSAREARDQRIALASRGFDAYQQTWTEAGIAGNDVPLMKRQHDQYVAAMNASFTTFDSSVEKALTQVRSYVCAYTKAYDDAQRKFDQTEAARLKAEQEEQANRAWPPSRWFTEPPPPKVWLGTDKVIRQLPASLRTEEALARTAVANATAGYRAFQAPPAAKFALNWDGLRRRLYMLLETAQSADLQAEERRLVRAVEGLNGRLAALADSSGLIPKARIEAAQLQASTTPPPGSGSLVSVSTRDLNSTIGIARELEALRDELPANASAQTALAGLVRSGERFLELIDRLQDAGDPVWRIVTDPVNESHWLKGFSKTYFRAEGDAGVVLVRDGPMRYRVQEGRNNPTTLIKGQLEISRAVASAAISVAGAATGLPVPNATTKPDDIDKAGASSQAEQLARRKEEATEIQRLRETTLRSLVQDLSGVLASLAASDGNAASVADQRKRLEAMLKGYRVIFEAQSE